MRFLPVLIICLLTATAVADDQKSDPQAQVASRRASIEKMKEHDRAEAYAKLALELTNLAAEQYKGDSMDQAQETARSIGDAATKSAEAGKMKHKKVKQAEIALRECSRRLDQLRRTLPVSEQGVVKVSLDQVEKARSELLEAMFR
jgi:hypothetical protein